MSHIPAAGQPQDAANVLPEGRSCVLIGCVNWIVMLGIMITLLSFGLAIYGFATVYFKPTGTEEGKRTVESLSVFLLYVGVGSLLLLVLLGVIIAKVSRQKR